MPHAIISHCGSEIVTGEPRKVAAKVIEMARERGIEATLADDGMIMSL